MLKRFLRAWVLEPTRRYQLITVASCVLLFFLPYWGWTPLWLLWMAGSWLSCRQADRRWLRLLHGGGRFGSLGRRFAHGLLLRAAEDIVRPGFGRRFGLRLGLAAPALGLRLRRLSAERLPSVGRRLAPEELLRLRLRSGTGRRLRLFPLHGGFARPLRRRFGLGDTGAAAPFGGLRRSGFRSGNGFARSVRLLLRSGRSGDQVE